MTHPLVALILELLEKNGEMHSSDIFASLPDYKQSTIKYWLGKLKKDDKVATRDRSYYSIPTTASTVSTQTSLNDTLNEISDALRSPGANKNTIDKLMNLYDDHVERYTEWFAKNINSNIDFEKQLLFMENFKWLTMIGDKLMKRWSLEHVGYDSNSRQAQEDAKAKTQAREKAALKDAPLEDTVQVVGHYHTDLKELWDAMPESEKEKRKV